MPKVSLEGAIESNSNRASVKICSSWENFENDKPRYMTDALFNKAMENIKYQHKRSSTFQTVLFLSPHFPSEVVEYIHTSHINNGRINAHIANFFDA